MFFGEFKHAVDQKNRIVVPSKFRAFVNDEDDKKGFIIGVSVTRDDRCLFMYPYSKMQKVIEDMRQSIVKDKKREEFLRLFSTNAEFVSIDSQSRIVIPQKLIDAVGLQRDVVLAGVLDRIEIWNTDDWAMKQKGHGDLKRELIERDIPESM